MKYLASCFLLCLSECGMANNDFHTNIPYQDIVAFLPVCDVELMNITIPESELLLLRLLVMSSPRKYTAYSVQSPRGLLTDAHFVAGRATLIFVHGFMQNATTPPISLISRTYLDLETYNVIMLDAFPLISMSYFKSVTAVTKIGRELGGALHELYLEGFHYKSLVLVGHSLGAHIMAFAGKEFFRRTGIKLPKIVGLDPAGPCYAAVPADRRLDAGDARSVQVIHTNGGQLGLMKPVGSLDFYVNGGRYQSSSSVVLFNFYYSHERSVYLWAYAVKFGDKFLAKKCSSVWEIDMNLCRGRGRDSTLMGPHADPRATGMYHLCTSDEPPFYREMDSYAYW